MKVVLFCGGLGTRVRAYSENIPKPMVPEAARNGDELVLEPFNRLIKTRQLCPRLDVHRCVLRGVGGESARHTSLRAANAKIEVKAFRERVLPRAGEDIKLWFEKLKARANPALSLARRHDDAHQDHRQVFRLTWNTFRDHCVLEYEIPKWDGDLGQPNLYMPVSQDRTAELAFWECRAPECYAEAFFARKLTVV